MQVARQPHGQCSVQRRLLHQQRSVKPPQPRLLHGQRLVKRPQPGRHQPSPESRQQTGRTTHPER